MNTNNTRTRSRLAIAAALVASVLFVYAAGLVGLLPAACLLVALVVLPRPFPFAVGQAALPATTTLDRPVLVLALELALLVLVVSDTPRRDHRRPLPGLVVGVAAFGFVWGALTVSGWSLTAATMTVAVLAVAVTYLIHRYTRVRLGLTTETPQ